MTVFLIFTGVLLGGKYLLALLMPFLLGTGLALAAEPVVRLCMKNGHISRPVAAAAGVSLTLLLLAGLLSLLGALAVRELGTLAKAMPDMQKTFQSGMNLLEDSVMRLADRAPDGVRPLLTGTVTDLFGNSSAMMENITRQVPGMVTGFLGKLTDGALGVGTGLLASYMISARLPVLRAALSRHIPNGQKVLPALRQVKTALGGWLKAQASLSALTFAIVTVGFFLLRVPHAPAWAALVAVVDAVPILGTGTVLVPWALVELLQGNHLSAMGLLGIYAAALLCRSILEPRLVGQRLGLDPLATLICLYAGYQLWGILGMILAPVFATAVKSLIDAFS